MSLRRHFAFQRYTDNWEGDCHRHDVCAREDRLDEICSALGDYLRERYIAKTALEQTLQRRLDEHGIAIDLGELLPSKPMSQNGSFGEALCLLCCREYGLLAPLDKLGGAANPNPDMPKPGIDVLGFLLMEQGLERDEIYVFEVKTLSTRGGVRASVRGKKNGVIRFFNVKVSKHPAFFHQEINAAVRALESQPETKPLAPRILALGTTPLAERRGRSHYCVVFLLDDGLDVEEYLQELRAIDHPPSQKWLRVLWFPGLRRVVRRAIEQAARPPEGA